MKNSTKLLKVKTIFLWLIIFCLFAEPLLASKAQSRRKEAVKNNDLKEIKGKVKKSIDHGVTFLKGQQKGGKWLNHPGVTSLCLLAMIKSPRNYNRLDGPWMRNPLEYIVKLQKKDGAIYDENSKAPTKNYVTSLSMIALSATKDPIYKDVIEKGKKFLIKIQVDEGEGYDKDKDYHWGGIGYGGDQRPDLSNLHIALEALTDAGLDKNHEVFKKALVFVERCQDKEGNKYFDTGNAEGGFAYSVDLPTNKNLPTDKSISKNKENIVIPYGSMTFAGIKTLIFCSVDLDDEKLTAALNWVEKNFSVDKHPGMQKGDIAIYYYYYTLAKALNMLEKSDATILEKRKIQWKVLLAKKLLERQQKDGSWVNKEKKYMEGVPVLCSAYAMNALNLIYEQL